MKTVQILYTTNSGNTEFTINQVEPILRSDFSCILQRVEIVPDAEIFLADALILACPTYGHGELFVNFQQFLARAPLEKLAGKPVAIIGLGDNKYDDDYTVEAAALLENLAKKSGARVFSPALRIVKTPVQALDSIHSWAQKLLLDWKKSV